MPCCMLGVERPRAAHVLCEACTLHEWSARGPPSHRPPRCHRRSPLLPVCAAPYTQTEWGACRRCRQSTGCTPAATAPNRATSGSGSRAAGGWAATSRGRCAGIDALACVSRHACFVVCGLYSTQGHLACLYVAAPNFVHPPARSRPHASPTRLCKVRTRMTTCAATACLYETPRRAMCAAGRVSIPHASVAGRRRASMRASWAVLQSRRWRQVHEALMGSTRASDIFQEDHLHNSSTTGACF